MIEQVWLFHCGWFRAPRGAFEAGGGLEIAKIPFLCLVAHHSKLGPIVVDAPFGHEGPTNAGEVLGSFLRRAGLSFRREWGIVPRIEQLGYRLSEVDNVLVTHLHWDHAGGMKELAQANFWIDTLEWEYATLLTPSEGRRIGYVQSDYRALAPRMQRMKLTESIDPSVGHDVFGDRSVEAVALRGHSPGHTGYRFHLTDGRTIFYVGDAVFTIPMITQELDYGVFPRLVASNLSTAELTSLRLRDWYRTTAPDDILVAAHDFEWGARCMEGPVALHAL